MVDTPVRDKYGRFVKTVSCESTTEPPLVHLRVTNPVVYIKLWWKKVMSGEGIDFRFRIHPVTAVLIATSIAIVAFGAGRVTVPINTPFFSYSYDEKPTPTPTSSPWKETALTGILKVTPVTKKYYLLTESTEAVTLEIPNNVNLDNYVGKRILASGNYNKSSKILQIADVLDLEVLPSKPTNIPTVTVIPTISPTTTPTATPTIISDIELIE